MPTSVEGTYRNGRVELNVGPQGVPDEMPVIVTFLHGGAIDLQAQGIDQRQAEELRTALATVDDWNDPAMNPYDDYDAAKSRV
jgi:hypothetical protein